MNKCEVQVGTYIAKLKHKNKGPHKSPNANISMFSSIFRLKK